MIVLSKLHCKHKNEICRNSELLFIMMCNQLKFKRKAMSVVGKRILDLIAVKVAYFFTDF